MTSHANAANGFERAREGVGECGAGETVSAVPTPSLRWEALRDSVGVGRADPVEQVDELLERVVVESGEGFAGGARDGLIELGEQLEARLGDATDDLAAVFGTAFSAYPSLGDEAVDEAGDAGRTFDHPVGDLERGQSFVAGAAEDAEDVVLLAGDAGGFEHLCDEAFHDVGGPQEAEEGLLLTRPERSCLADLPSDKAFVTTHNGMVPKRK